MARAAAATSLDLRNLADRRGHDPSPCGGSTTRESCADVSLVVEATAVLGSAGRQGHAVNLEVVVEHRDRQLRGEPRSRCSWKTAPCLASRTFPPVLKSASLLTSQF
eukprot:4343591-Heterocapsa_arctica.AAC.1